MSAAPVRRSLILSTLVRLTLAAGWLLLGAGILLHATVRDGIDRIAIAFYALPLPVLAALALGLSGCRSQSRRSRAIAALLAIALFAAWITRSHHGGAISSESADLTVLVWNLSRPEAPSEKLVQLILEHQPDVISIVEPGRKAGDHISWYEERLPGYKAAWMPRGILWLSRVPSRYRSRGKLDGIGAYAWFDVRHPSGMFRFVSIDVHPYPLLPRKPQLTEALAWTEGRPHAILAGDFNTPLESVHFAPYRTELTNAFEKAGRGFRETWFWGLPLLSLDQIWCGPEWLPLSVKKIHTTASDHAALLATFQRVKPGSSVQSGNQPHESQP